MYAMSVHIVFMLCAKYTNLEKWPKRRRAQYAHVNRLKVTDRLNDALYVIQSQIISYQCFFLSHALTSLLPSKQKRGFFFRVCFMLVFIPTYIKITHLGIFFGAVLYITVMATYVCVSRCTITYIYFCRLYEISMSIVILNIQFPIRYIQKQH